VANGKMLSSFSIFWDFLASVRDWIVVLGRFIGGDLVVFVCLESEVVLDNRFWLLEVAIEAK
jgi:hypothetical protein